MDSLLFLLTITMLVLRLIDSNSATIISPVLAFINKLKLTGPKSR